VPSIGGWACEMDFNTIFINDRDPFALGFSFI
jgi:4-hydroxyproline epimerase